MSLTSSLSRTVWLGLWRGLRRWCSYECVGFDRVVDTPGALIVGYHGAGAAWDLLMLASLVHDELGYLPCGVAHDSFFEPPILRDIARALSLVPRRGPQLREALGRGEHLLIAPGGTREGLRPWWRRYEVDWGGRQGFARLAVELQVPIIPVGADGVDELYIGLNDGHRLAKRLGITGIGPWVALGMGGLFPFALPFPVRVRQYIGAPIRSHLGDEARPDAVGALAAETRAAVQALIDEARVAAPPPRPGQIVFSEGGP